MKTGFIFILLWIISPIYTALTYQLGIDANLQALFGVIIGMALFWFGVFWQIKIEEGR